MCSLSYYFFVQKHFLLLAESSLNQPTTHQYHMTEIIIVCAKRYLIKSSAEENTSNVTW